MAVRMPDIEIDLADDEDVIRVYTRRPDEPWSFTKLRPSDFARIMASHSGISLWRLKYTTREYAMARLGTPKLTGTAICKAKVLKSLGMRFFGKSLQDPHVSTRCPGCDLNTNYEQEELCEKLDGSRCAFEMHAENSMCATLLRNRIFTVDLPIQATKL